MLPTIFQKSKNLRLLIEQESAICSKWGLHVAVGRGREDEKHKQLVVMLLVRRLYLYRRCGSSKCKWFSAQTTFARPPRMHTRMDLLYCNLVVLGDAATARRPATDSEYIARWLDILFPPDICLFEHYPKAVFRADELNWTELQPCSQSTSWRRRAWPITRRVTGSTWSMSVQFSSPAVNKV